MELKGKTAIVTGGASGLGEAVASLFTEKGANVAIFDLNDEAGEAAEKAAGGSVRYFNTDVADPDGVAASVSGAADAFGAIHICVNCAGIGRAGKTFGKDGPLALDQYTKVLNVNLIGTFNVIRLAAEQMAKNEP
ncbi:MAG: SDR family NAD(P)-dependent oxidoreductase, partial [Pseudomonadota bacterium]